mmetsp:Transcript_10995/g.23492  ORF Transcript_10995/g.23492 Transcript_10995/m.23492 type:complete len:291 (-) Transcript_10995:198-1070(-)|eukprot:6204876-Pleurochrysis_carterae.AAC.2
MSTRQYVEGSAGRVSNNKGGEATGNPAQPKESLARVTKVHSSSEGGLSASPTENFEVFTTFLVWRCIPSGLQRLTFQLVADGSCTNLLYTDASCCCCCCAIKTQIPRGTAPVVRKQAFWNWPRLLRDAPLSFLLAFLIHLVPSIIWGAEESLGSPENHALMGVVWFGLWPVWYILLQLLRPWGISLDLTCCACEAWGGIFVPFASYKHATEVCAYWRKAYTQRDPSVERPPSRARLCDAFMLIGILVLAGLLANAIYTGVEVLACSDRGCCADDKSTLDNCTATGYPDRS